MFKHNCKISPLFLNLALAPLFPLSSFATAQDVTTTALPPIQINASRPGNQSSVAGISGASLNETPVSVSISTADSVRNYGFTSLSGLMRLEPAAGDSYNTLGYVESLNLRGFLLDNRFNYRRDGLPISNHMPIAFENKERYETLKGTSGLLAGVSAPGGLLNAVLKRPTSQALNDAGLTLSERGSSQAYADLSRRNEDFGYRINLGLADRKPFADNAPGSRQFVSALVDWRFKGHVFEAEFEYQNSRQISVPGLGLLDTNDDGLAETLPSLPSARLNLNSQTWALPFESKSLIGSVKWESPQFVVGAQTINVGLRANWQGIKTNDRIAFPDGCSAGTNYVYPGLCGNYDVDIYDFRSDNERRNMRNIEAWLRSSFATGSVTHNLRAVLLQTQYRERFEDLQTYNFVGTINALNPTQLPADPTPSSLNTNSDRRSTELSISDAMALSKTVSLWLGLRHTRLTASSARTNGTRNTNYDQSFTTPWASLSFKPSSGMFFYVSVGQGVESEVAPNRTNLFENAGSVLPALKSQQIEIGAKLSLAQWGQINVAAYRTKKPFADDVILAGDLKPTRVSGARQALHTGFEMQWQQNLTPTIDLLTSYSLLNARQTVALDPALIGKRVTNVEPWSLTAALGWQPSSNFRWQNTVSVNAGKPVTADNSVKLPSAPQWDTWVSYKTTTQAAAITFRAGIDNVLDRRYWRDAPTQSWGGLYLFAAQPRTFRIAVSGSF